MNELASLRYAKALSHPTRVRILMAMNSPRRDMSPKDFSDETDTALGNASYHFRRLEKFGFVEVVETKQRRGATEHFYGLKKRALVWTEESKSLPPSVLEGLSATVLRGFVEEVGASLDSGHFNDRDDRALAWDKMRVDEEGWGELSDLFHATLERALEIETKCDARRRETGEEGFLASYVLATFPSPERPSAT